MQENQTEFDKYTTQILNVSKKYFEELNKIQNEIKKEFPKNYSKNSIYQLCEKNRFQVFANIDFELCGKDRFIHLFKQITSNNHSKMQKAIIYLIIQGFEKDRICNIIGIPKNNLTTYIDRIGDKLCDNEFIQNYYYNDEKCKYFFVEKKSKSKASKTIISIKDVYRFINKIFQNL